MQTKESKKHAIHLIPLWYRDALTKISFAYHQLYKPILGRMKSRYRIKKGKKLTKKAHKMSQNLKKSSSLNSLNNVYILNK